MAGWIALDWSGGRITPIDNPKHATHPTQHTTRHTPRAKRHTPHATNAPPPPHTHTRHHTEPRRTCAPVAWQRWYTIVALVTVLPVPGGPWISDSGWPSTDRTACSWLWLSSGRLGADAPPPGGRLTRSAAGSTWWPSSEWKR